MHAYTIQWPQDRPDVNVMIYASQGYENFYNLTLMLRVLDFPVPWPLHNMYVVYQIFKKLDT